MRMDSERIRRIGVGLAAALLLAAGVGVTAGYFYLRSSADPPKGTLRVEGDALSAPVQVQVDAYGVPYLSASTQEDLFFGQGFAHASDRLFQMEILRRTAAGRLSEIFGPAALDVDRVVRTLDLWGAAGRSVAALSAEERRLMEAYAAGVNAGIRHRADPLPPEFVILGFEPDPWTPRASLAVGKVMALDLSPWSHELDRSHAYRVLPEEKFAFVEPRYPAWAPTILSDTIPVPVPREADGRSSGAGEGDGGASDTVGDPAAGPGRRVDPGGDGDRWEPVAWLTALAPFRSSNAWAVSGVRTASGRPLLANDMHLGLQAPPTWYIMSLRAGSTYRVAGFSLPGVPGIVVGLNPDVAWGFTNGVVDDMDFTVERLDSDGRRYRDGDQWHQLVVRPETLRVRGRDQPVLHRVRETSRGPLITDAVPGLDVSLSVRWTAASATTEFRGLLAMNRARDAESFDGAVMRLSSPQQNVVYATAEGIVGYRLSGRVPLRSEGARGAIPRDARRHPTVWRGFWSPAQLPAGRDPTRGYLATANNLQAPNLFGVLGTDYPLPFRARRIVDRLESRGDWDVASTVELQRDTRSLLAGRLRDRAVAAARRAGEDSAAARLQRWDLHADTDRPGASLFYLWLYRLRDLVAADEYASQGEVPVARGRTYFPDEALLRLLESDGTGNPWVDDVGTPEVETLTELEERAARHAAEAAGGRPWGEVHLEQHAHPLGRVEWLDVMVGFDVGPLSGPGGPYTVRPDDQRLWSEMDGSAGRPPAVGRYGPSERFVAEMIPDGRSQGHFLVPTGQSGNPFSPHYRDLLSRWKEGRLLRVPLDSAGIANRVLRGYQLAPRESPETPVR